MTDFKGKNVVVLGMGKSGIAAARLLNSLGAHVTISESGDGSGFKKQIKALEEININVQTGGHTDTIIEDAKLLVISPGIASNIDIVNKASQKGIPVVGEIELACGFIKAPIVAITGTNGKTTTTTLIGNILSKSKGTVDVAGNIGKPLSEVALGSANEVVVAEISSFQLETINKFHPRISVILNLTPDHLDRYKDMRQYASAKKRIFENQGEGDFLIANADDDAVCKMVKDANCKVVFFSTKKELEEGVYISQGNIIARLDGKGSSFPLSVIKIPGMHNVENVLASVAVSIILNVENDILIEAISGFGGVEHRLETVREINGVKFINDSKATNVDSVIRALESFNAPIVLIAGGRDKGSPYTPLKELVREKVKALVLLGEGAQKIKEELGTETDVSLVVSMKEAVKVSFKVAAKGDIVLLSPACSSYDMFENYEERGRVFKELVKAL
ncbi:MAG: UDP-N-acetylmuramoyl-L-alanine--D-glutamate ligase [bacterium]